jgi:hypothetical protein
VRSEDTFEKTAEKVGDVVNERWSEAKQFRTRVIDNELPKGIRDKVEVFIRAIEEVVKAEEPNAKLRVFLEKEEDLEANFKPVKKLEGFAFGKYREIKKFVENPVMENALGDFKEKFEDVRKTVLSEAIVDRINEATVDYGGLLDAFSITYEEQHGEFNKWIIEALEVVEHHNAFALKPEEAGDKAEELRSLQCKNLVFDSSALYCKSCRKHFTDMHASVIRGVKQKVLRELDTLIPPIKPPEPFEIREEVRSEEIERVIEKIRAFFSKYKGMFEVEIRIKPGD